MRTAHFTLASAINSYNQRVLPFNSLSRLPIRGLTIGTSVTLTLPIATGGTAPYTYSLSASPETATEVVEFN